MSAAGFLKAGDVFASEGTVRLRRQVGVRTEGYRMFANGFRVTGVTTATSVIDKPGLRSWERKVALKVIRSRLVAGKALDAQEIATLLADANGEPNRIRKGGTDTGSAAAKWIELYVKGRKPAPPVDPTVKALADQFRDWELDHRVKWLASEWSVVDPVVPIGGILDLFGLIDGVPTIPDVKALNEGEVYPEHELQLSAYHHIVTAAGVPAKDREAAALVAGVKPEEIARRLLILNKPRDPEATPRAPIFEPDHFVRTDVEEDWLAVCAAARLRQRIPGRDN